MQHDVLPAILEALVGLAPRTRRSVGAGLWVVESAMPEGVSAAGVHGRSAAPIASALVWRELDPPRPARVVASNHSGERVIADAGTVLRGGMSTRAVSRPVSVPAGGVLAVEVEPLGARWWAEGRLYEEGRLGAVARALLLHAAYGETATRHCARAALWGLPEVLAGGDSIGDVARAAGGFVVGGGEEVLTAWLPLAGAGARVEANDHLAALCLRAIRRGLVSVRHSDAHDGFLLVPRGLQLADRAVAAAAGVFG